MVTQASNAKDHRAVEGRVDRKLTDRVHGVFPAPCFRGGPTAIQTDDVRATSCPTQQLSPKRRSQSCRSPLSPSLPRRRGAPHPSLSPPLAHLSGPSRHLTQGRRPSVPSIPASALCRPSQARVPRARPRRRRRLGEPPRRGGGRTEMGEG